MSRVSFAQFVVVSLMVGMIVGVIIGGLKEVSLEVLLTESILPLVT